MKKLDDIPKESIFKVPDGYFEQLPTVIQSRMENASQKKTMNATWALSLKLAIPVLALIVAGIFWLQPARTLDTELGEIDAEQIAYFLEDAEPIAFDEAHEDDFGSIDIDELEQAVYSEMDTTPEESDNLFNDIDLENL